MGSLIMDTVSMNHYEKQLYSVFKTFDVDNEEALNKSAVLDLCDALQLEDRGAALVDSLFERRTDRVTFTQFRNGLLSVLGGGESSTGSKDPIASSSPTTSAAVSFTADSSPGPALSQSDEDSSGREIAPRIVFGSKKYGRRSRPQRSTAVSDECPSPRAASVSRIDTEDKRVRNSQRMKYRRSTSAMDTRGRHSFGDYNTSSDGFDHNRHINYEQALNLCRELRMDSIDPSLVESIFEDSHSKDDITVGEFFDKLNASLSSSIEVARNDTVTIDNGDVDDNGDDETVGISSECIINCWENAGVPHPQRLLIELGFTGARVRPPDLEHALEDELRACTEPLDNHLHARTVFLTAALEFDRLRLKRAKHHMELALAERDKLRSDVTEANRRASMLAQENDESHVRMEAELAASVRRAEARLAEATRQAAAERAAERERDTAARARLEVELAHRAENEIRLREEIDTQITRNVELEIRATAAETRAVNAERLAARLAEEVSAVNVTVERQARGAAGGAVDERAEQLTELRAENQRLRDRNDELCCALEARTRIDAPVPAQYSGGGDLSAELGELLHYTEECDSSPASLEPRTLSYGEAARRLRELLRAGDALPTWQDKILEISNALMLMEQSSINVEASVQTDKQTYTSNCQKVLNDTTSLSHGQITSEGQAKLSKKQTAFSDVPTVSTDGPTALSDGQIASSDGPTASSDGPTALSDGQIASSDGPTASSDGPTALSDGQTVSSKEQTTLGDEQTTLNDGQIATCDGQCRVAEQLRQKLAETSATHVEEKQKLTDLVKELELSLEQLKEEYDRCEEYWSGKLEEERDALVEEQRLGDERLAELASKISEYERQFAPSQGLPTIQEVGLEAQVTDLEEEFASYRSAREDELRERDERIERLAERIRELQAQGSGSCSCSCAALAERVARLSSARTAVLREASVLRARACSAEAAVRRLHARLAAADLLVKDLYLENCQLARAAPL